MKIDHGFNEKNYDWISHFHKKGEWAVAYCGTTGITKKSNKFMKMMMILGIRGKR